MDTNTSSTLDKRAAITAKQNLQIVRQRHQGRTFVNSTSSNADAQEWTGFSKPISERMKFVAQKNPEGRKKRRERSRAASNSTSTSEGKDSPEKRNSSNGTVPEKAHDQMVTDHMERHPGSDCSSISTDQALDLSDLWSVSEAGFLEDFASQAGTYPGLEAWSPEELPTLWSDNNKGFVTYYTKYLYLPLSLPFETLYSITDCSQQISESGDFLLSDPLALDCTLSICALFNLLENGKQDSAESPFHCSKLCALANQILSSDETGSPARQMLIIQPVSSLAIIAGLVGNYNDWYLHMQGLKSLVNSLGGQERLSPRMRTLIRQ
ncbi:hypothetical protein N7470_002743 [Penicillium chermesinum]|nr:hypothetical protein N7470_002743 [Penicillium chermesinum]